MPARAHCAFAGRPWCLPMDNAAIDRLMHEGLRQKTFPGAVLLAAIGNEPFFFKAYGHADLFSGRPMTPHTVFDLASLTKPLATTLAVASLVRRGMIDLDRPIGHELSIPDHNDKAVITPRQLLCHQSGLPAHRLFYMQLKRLTPKLRRSALLDLLLQTSLDDLPGRRTLYSDLGFMLLCRLIETVAGCRLDRYLMSWVYGPLGLAEALFFVDLVGGGRPAGNFAATELCPVRNRLLVGEVHDDNAWYSGGVDGHAGLFGTAEAVFRLLRYLVRHPMQPESLQIFSGRMVAEVIYGNHSKALPMGFDRPSCDNSSAGQYFSPSTIGHLGYTGVSFWMDLEKDVCIILLTNRVHPTRWNDRLRQFRPAIHNRIMKQIENHPD